jgi:hypothetical protein
MKTSVRLFLIFLLAALFQPIYAQISFNQGNAFKYLKGNAATVTPETILAASFNDAGWGIGVSPFRYGKGAGGTVLDDMRNLYTTFFLRTTFTAQNTAQIGKITFTVNYDDAFVIYINGKSALAINTPTPLTTTGLALVNHDPGTNEFFTVDATKLGLVDGVNTIAIMVFNLSLNSSDIYFDLGMTAALETLPYDYGADNVQFSREAGFCSDVFNLTMSSPVPEFNVLYTTDGSDPKTSLTAILGGNNVVIPIDPSQSVGRGTTPGFVVRASLIKTGFKPSNSVTNSYIFLSKVKTQAYPGGKWPSASVNGQILDYAMATDVVSSTTYAPYIDAAFKQIPSISIVTDMDNLFSSATGIYVNPAQSGILWERPCSVELIDTNSVRKFQINAGLRIRGAASKDPSNPKHAFRFYFREDYGPKKLHYPLFESEGTDEFDCIDLRCEQNYSWSKDGSPYNNLVTDIFSRDVQGKMGQPYKRGRYYHLYLNGMYWGIFQTDERAEADFAESYLGGNSEDYDVVKVNSDQWPYYDEVTDGYIDTWSALWTKCATGFDTNANYFALLGKKADGTPDPSGKVWVDIDNLIDYMLVIFYTGNFDAPVSSFYSDDMPNNFYALYNRNDKTKGFRFLTHDSEHSMFVNAVYGAGIQENRVNIGTNGRMSITKMTDFNPQWLHFKLSKNAEYKTRFMDRAFRQLTTGGLLTPENAAKLYQSRAAQIDKAIIAESARWGDAKTSPSLTKQTWLTENQSKYTSFFPQRTDILKTQLLNEGLYASMLTPEVLVDGILNYDRFFRFTGTKIVKLVDMNALTNSSSIYYTLDDTDPRLVGGVIAPGAFTGKGTVDVTINHTTILNARLYKSGTWGPLRKLVLSYADEDYSKLKVTELNYHPVDSIIGTDTINGQDFEFIEFKNTGTTPIDLSGLRLDSAVYYQFPDEQLLSPGAFYVVASKPNIFFSKYKQYPSGNFTKNLSNSGEEVVLLNRNNIPVLSFTYDDSYPWPDSPDGDGFTLTSKYVNPNGNPASPAYWMASSTLNGSPFMDDFSSLTSLDPDSQEHIQISVYPNPTNGLFYVNTGQNQTGVKNLVSVFDTKGSLILQVRFEGTAIIDLSKHPIQDGVYIVKVQTSTKTAAQKIIYMH